jgi:Leucine-rich repeat (LRR) protein
MFQLLHLQVLDFSSSSSSSTYGSSNGSNLRSADLSYNQISQIQDLDNFRRLSRLVLDGNQIQHIGGGLRQLHCLQHLSLSGNKISSCRGLAGAA